MRAAFTSIRFTEHLELVGIQPSIGSVGDASVLAPSHAGRVLHNVPHLRVDHKPTPD